ncbi:hypothetical protein AA0498_0923 [Acidomonas methanolica]|uniref:Uncharacterized protein n=1 Tax=Acidomonas methanolica NBRC 104435 TaxID=1231351 RepID=A0A023D969_ACIMT|nr:hypothetical protein Amme_228_004 [Acidomonas methanolica NBRC 104435]GBQ49180.1 hypothetical protein AA0498_0923 [Acidomonas methanolica]GEL00654.1 hypothetical protein AME01nite_31520 [Acidomonas methanolica NBRC 104435]
MGTRSKRAINRRTGRQTRAMIPSAGSDGAMPVKRTKAVIPTAPAPITENMI